MSKPYSPDISLYSDLNSFFQDFYSMNKDLNPKFSYQYLAKKLGWSAPYLNDVFKGRKKLSLKRMLEFTSYLGLKGPHEERFLILNLAASDNEFAQSSLKNTALSSTNSSLATSTVPLEQHQEYGNLLDYYISMYLNYQKGYWDPDHFLKSLMLPSKPTLEELEASIERLIKIKTIAPGENSGPYKILQDDHRLLHLGEKDLKSKEDIDTFSEIMRIEREYSKAYMNHTLMAKKGSISAVNGIIHLNEENYQEVKKRLVALHNYLIQISEKSDHENLLAGDGVSRKVWQYQMNLFSVFQ